MSINEMKRFIMDTCQPPTFYIRTRRISIRFWSLIAACGFCLASYGTLHAQVCDGSITLTTQAEVDAFDCSLLDGYLTINGEDITNLNSLSALNRVWGLEIIGNPVLPDMTVSSR